MILPSGLFIGESIANLINIGLGAFKMPKIESHREGVHDSLSGRKNPSFGLARQVSQHLQ